MLYWLTKQEVLAMHSLQITHFGGATGMRDEGLLESALARAQNIATYAESTPSLVQLAAAYGAGIVRNHPFVDGNKRAGFVIGVLFLELNGFKLRASEEDATQAVMSLAAGTLDEAGYREWLRENARRNR